MESNFPLVSIILLSFNRPEYLKDALQSIVNQSYSNIEIIVIDNQSPNSNIIAEVVTSFPMVKFIRNLENNGFTGGMNRGIELAIGDYIYLTEDDMVLEKDCIKQFVNYMNNNPSIHMATGIIYNKKDGRIWCAGGEVKLKGIFKQKIFGAGEKDQGQFLQPFSVNYISGAMMFARRELLQRLGGFRSDFFMYFEDVDLCERVLKSNSAIMVVPQAKAFHFEPLKIPDLDQISFHKLKNFFAIYLLYAPLIVWPEFISRYVLLALCRNAFTNRNHFNLILKACLWILINTPSLLKARLMK